MSNIINKKIEELDNRRAQILRTLCEDEKIFFPEVILMLVNEAKSITKILKILKSSNES